MTDLIAVLLGLGIGALVGVGAVLLGFWLADRW